MTINKSSPGTPRDYRDHYFPGTEDLAPDELRVIALGTGMPLVRRSQASASFLIQLGNGENFIFDMEDEISNICRTFALGSKKQEENLIESLKQNCRRIVKAKTGKKPYTNINIARI